MLKIYSRVTFDTPGTYMYKEWLTDNSVVFVKTDNTVGLSKLREIHFFFATVELRGWILFLSIAKETLDAKSNSRFFESANNGIIMAKRCSVCKSNYHTITTTTTPMMRASWTKHYIIMLKDSIGMDLWVGVNIVTGSNRVRNVCLTTCH